MRVAAVFHGSPAELMALLSAVERNCSCADPEVGTGKCPSHRALLDQRFLDGLAYALWLRRRLLAEEFKP